MSILSSAKIAVYVISASETRSPKGPGGQPPAKALEKSHDENCGSLHALRDALCFPAEAQQPGKVVRIGYLDLSTASASAALLEAFRQELRKFGWNEGKNITIEYRFADQNSEGLPELAAELVRLKVDLIVVSGAPPALAAKKATTTIPIVMTNVADPVAAGLIGSLARPGGNVTGLSTLGTGLNTKRLEILKDAIPKLARVGLLRVPSGGIG